MYHTRNRFAKKAGVLTLFFVCMAGTVIHVESKVVLTPGHPRRAWWRAARFGMFIHWGPVSLTGRELSWSRANSNTNCPNHGPIAVAVANEHHRTADDQRNRIVEMMRMNNPMDPLDWTIIVVYLVAVVGLGVAAGFWRRKNERGGEGGHYFLAGNTLAWPVIGLAMFAANISTVHLVSLAEAAYKYGLVFGNFEWMAGFTLILLSLFFAPLYLRSRVATLPDFLERRFNRGCRDVLSVVSLFSAIVIHMGVALYTAAWVLRGILDLAPGAKTVRRGRVDAVHHRAGIVDRHLHHARRFARRGVDRKCADRSAPGRRGGHHRRRLSENRRLDGTRAHARVHIRIRWPAWPAAKSPGARAIF